MGLGLHPVNFLLNTRNPQVLASKLVGGRQSAQQEDGSAVATTPTTTTPTTHKGAATVAASTACAAAHQTDGDNVTREEEDAEGRPPWRDVAEVGGEWAGAAAKPRRSAGEEEEEAVRIVAVDLQEMAPIEGVKQLQVQTDRRYRRGS